MALHLNLDQDSRVYFTLTCDDCATPFTCYDDACYSFASLRTAATFAGWDAGTRPEQPHHCPNCARTTPADQTRRKTQPQPHRTVPTPQIN